MRLYNIISLLCQYISSNKKVLYDRDLFLLALRCSHDEEMMKTLQFEMYISQMNTTAV